MRERCNDVWVAAEIERCAEAWHECAADPPSLDPQYSLRDHEARELAYDAELRAVEWEARCLQRPGRLRSESKDRVLSSFARFAVHALDLEPETVTLLTQNFLPAGIEFARRARQFDAHISRADTIQACRNAWTACGLQPLFGETMRLTPSILAYSLLYPYSDNYLDSADESIEAKMAFSGRFRDRLRGIDLPPLNEREGSIWALVAMIEAQYPRPQFPQVFDCLLAIHSAQEESILQLGGRCHASDLLRLSFAKGGTSVLADACLARGWMNEEERRVGFEWGALLQLGDDLQDVHDDLRRASLTLFTQAVAKGEQLDDLVLQLLSYCEQVADRMNRLPHGSQRLKKLLRMSWRSLILAAVADAHEFFSPEFVSRAERCSPFRFEFLRERRTRLADSSGLYPALFDLFVEPYASDWTRATVQANRPLLQPLL
jgi:hypothetical protein